MVLLLLFCCCCCFFSETAMSLVGWLVGWFLAILLFLDFMDKLHLTPNPFCVVDLKQYFKDQRHRFFQVTP